MPDKTVYSFPSADRATLPEVGGKGLSLMIGSRRLTRSIRFYFVGGFFQVMVDAVEND
jgi:hypothetical protein